MPESPQQLRNFVGTFPTAIDSQRRLAIPKLWRLDTDTEETPFFLTVGSGPSLEFYPYEEYIKRVRMSQMMMSNEETDLLGSGAAAASTIIKLDKQGRAIIPAYMLLEADIQDNVYCLGSFFYGRIIAAKIWDAIKPKKQTINVFNHSISPPDQMNGNAAPLSGNKDQLIITQ